MCRNAHRVGEKKNTKKKQFSTTTHTHMSDSSSVHFYNSPSLADFNNLIHTSIENSVKNDIENDYVPIVEQVFQNQDDTFHKKLKELKRIFIYSMQKAGHSDMVHLIDAFSRTDGGQMEQAVFVKNLGDFGNVAPKQKNFDVVISYPKPSNPQQ